MPAKQKKEELDSQKKATSSVTFDVFCIATFATIYATGRLNLMLVYFLDTLKSSGAFVFFYEAEKDINGNDIGTVLKRETQKEFFDKHLATFGKGAKDAFKCAMRPFTIIFSPTAPKINNSSGVLNLYCESQYKASPPALHTDQNFNFYQYWITKIINNFVDNDIEGFNIIVSWCKSVLNGVPPRFALLLYGPEGTGKSVFADLLCKILPTHLSINATIDDLKFNSVLFGKALVIINEFNTSDDKFIQRIKEMITAETYRFATKNVTGFTGANISSFIFTSNADLSKTVMGRRYMHCRPQPIDAADMDDFKTFCGKCKDDPYVASFFYQLIMSHEVPEKLEIPPRFKIEDPSDTTVLAPLTAAVLSDDEQRLIGEFMLHKIRDTMIRANITKFKIQKTGFKDGVLDYFALAKAKNKKLNIPSLEWNKEPQRNALYEFAMQRLKMVEHKKSVEYFSTTITSLFDILWENMPNDNNVLLEVVAVASGFGMSYGMSHDPIAEEQRQAKNPNEETSVE